MEITLLAISTLCKNLNFTNFGTVGQCFVENTMFGDVTLAGIIIFILFVALIVRYSFPIQIILPVGISLTYVLWLMTNASVFLGFFILSLIIGGAILIIGLIQHLNK